jgi:sporadic carbohydrate cluster protein (TIGR04323 family)
MMNGRSVPQHIQQQVIRAYCEKKGFEFLLSATEYCMGGTLILDAALEEDTDGIVMYSMYLMPEERQKRIAAAARKPIHFAAENCIYTPEMEDTFDLIRLCAWNQNHLLLQSTTMEPTQRPLASGMISSEVLRLPDTESFASLSAGQIIKVW